MRLQALITAALVVGCPGESAGPQELACPGAVSRLCTSEPGDVTAAGIAVRDIGARNARSLANSALRQALESEATLLAAALEGGFVTRGRESLARMRFAIDAAKGQPAATVDGPEIAAVELSLRPAGRLLDR